MKALAALALALAAPLAGAAPDRYTMADFARVPKIDVHTHLHGTLDRFVARMRADGMRVLTINVDYADFPPLAVQRAEAIALAHRYPGEIAWVASFDARGLDAPGWTAATLASLDAARAAGAVGVKVWKNVGMSVRDGAGRLVMIDDPRLDPLFERLAAERVVVLGHQGEPKNCWLPAAEMTIAGDREYFTRHPAYWMALHPEMPSREAQLAARDRRLERTPGLAFVGLHLASLEADVDELARFLDRFPEATVDLAARLVHLQRQAVAGHAKVRDFVLRYQDRLLYGTDIARLDGTPDAAFAAEADAAWRADWRFLVTGDRLRSPEFAGAFRGLALPRTVVDKIFRTNALRRFPGAWDATMHASPPPP
jgi:predicted TIM-barrel fold metal-dependent hydrolase